MAEQETVQKSEYDLELEKIEEAYDVKVKADDKFNHLAHKEVPELARLLEIQQADGTTLSPDDIREQIMRDCKKYWTPNYINECLPEKFRRRYDQSESEESEDEDETLSATPSDNPAADTIRSLREELRNEQKTRVQAQKLYDKAHEKINKLTTELGEITTELKDLRKSSKILKFIEPIYDTKLNAIHLTVTGNSNVKLTEYLEDKGKTKDIQQETELVFKLGEKIVLESIS